MQLATTSLPWQRSTKTRVPCGAFPEEGLEGREGHLTALAEGEACGDLIGENAEDERHHGARQVGVEHRLEGAQLGRLVLV